VIAVSGESANTPSSGGCSLTPSGARIRARSPRVQTRWPSCTSWSG